MPWTRWPSTPLQYLIGPKLVASLIAVPLLVALFDVVGIYGG